MTEPAQDTGEGGTLAQAGSTEVGNLDLSRAEDRRLLTRAAKRWALPRDLRDQSIQALKVALGLAVEAKDVRGINSCLRSMTAMEGQNQADDHLLLKNDRLDEGRPTEIVKEIGVNLHRFQHGTVD